MLTLETLRRSIDSTESLHAVVRTMKVLSMTSIRQSEEAVEALAAYDRTVRRGLQIALRHRPREAGVQQDAAGSRVGAIVFGSAWGMCGRFNEQLAAFAAEHLADANRDDVTLLALGEFVGDALEDEGCVVDDRFGVPDAVEGIPARVHELLVAVDAWRAGHQVDRVVLFYHRLVSRARYEPQAVRLLPIDRAWLAELEAEPWPTHVVPTFRVKWETLFAALVRQYLFVTLYRAFAESLAAEHSSRLAAMQRAEENVEERLGTLRARFHRQRQNAITEELLDITSGYEALRTADSR